jgi:ubiquinone/menaquinone biosynthesis C-methylase UbiE
LLYGLDQIRGHYRKLLEEKPSDYYERFDPYILDKRPLVSHLVERAFADIFPEKVPHLLDVGCGTCFYFPLLAPHAEKLTGIDLCIPMLEQARELIEAKGIDNCEIKESSALELPFEDESFDAVHSWDFLHHVPDAPTAAAEIARVLKPGGRYIAVEPNILNPSIAHYHARRRAEWGLYSKNQFTNRRIFKRHGFDVSIRFDNTIISFLNEKTWKLWKAIDAFTSIWPTRYLSFRYVMECRKPG